MTMSSKACCIALALMIAALLVPARALTPKEDVGKQLFFDTGLSTPAGMSCATCHDPAAAMADPRPGTPTSQGVVHTRYGARNSPAAAYHLGGPEALQMFNAGYAGGLFLDGRANTLADQAMGPFLNPLEMKNPNERAVVLAVRSSAYARLFREVYGDDVFGDVHGAYLAVADAIAEYERSEEVNPFSSKLDRYHAGDLELSPMERMGMMLFGGKGGCTACHNVGRGAGTACPGGCTCGCEFTGVCKCQGCSCGCPTAGTQACSGGCMCGCASTGVCTCPTCDCGCLQTGANTCPGGCRCGCAFTRVCTCGSGCGCGCSETPLLCEGGCGCGCDWTHVCDCGGTGCECGCPSGGVVDGHPMFTNLNYFNLGVPANPDNPFYGLPGGFNPDGDDWIDVGLGKVLADRGIAGAESEMGKFRVPSLRNVALSAPYMHNGVFPDLRTVIEFYNTRDVPGAGWGPPEVGENIFHGWGIGELGLSAVEVEALVAFLETLTDGYEMPGVAERSAPTTAGIAGTSAAAIRGAYPNPFAPSTQIAFELRRAASVRLAVYDLTGRRVRTLIDASLPAGPAGAQWDGRDDQGRRVACGMYSCVLAADGQRQNMRVVMMK